MNTEGAWGIICLFGFVIISVLVFKLVMNTVGAHRIAALV